MSITNNVPCYNVICFPNGANKFNNAHVVSSIPARWSLHPSYMHTFGLTQNYFIIVEQPLSISVLEAVKTRVMREPLASMFKWFQNEYTLIHVICRRSGRRKFTFKAGTFFYLHIINAYESDDHIVVDICCYRDPSMLDCMYVDAMENMQNIVNYANMFKSRPLRFVLPINVPCSDCYIIDESSMLLSFKWMTCMRRATSEKPHQNINNVNRVFDNDNGNENDDENATIESGHEIRCNNENLVKLKNSTAKAYRIISSNDDNEPVIFCVPETLCDLGCETPRINEKLSQGRERKREREKGNER